MIVFLDENLIYINKLRKIRTWVETVLAFKERPISRNLLQEIKESIAIIKNDIIAGGDVSRDQVDALAILYSFQDQCGAEGIE